MRIAVFENMRAVIRADQLCKEQGIKAIVMPLPETLSSECGMCLSIDDNSAKFEELMKEAAIAVRLYDKI